MNEYTNITTEHKKINYYKKMKLWKRIKTIRKVFNFKVKNLKEIELEF